MAFADGLVPVHKLVIGGNTYTIYVGLLAVAANIIAAAVANVALRAFAPAPARA
jgi:SSS family solute:Na+ symporter